ncbi:aluminum activated malate transporter family protein [Perilla frutescens var. frutescens]|nr:aluminum activated malate transporter family protein [Perilla frutescens var. frutescens]
MTKKIGKNDPRRMMHSMKVGLAITLASLLFYIKPLYGDFKEAGMWAIITAVVVFEFTVGQRNLVKEHEQRRCNLAVSGSRERVDDIVGLARERLTTILIGAAICIFISISLCPVWAGFGAEFFSFDGDENGDSHNTLLLLSYKNVLDSKAIEESLANFAWWEPPHGRFRFRHPWKQYLNIGTLTRECATKIQTLGVYINSKPKVASELASEIQEACTRMSRESGNAMKEVASVIKNMRPPSPALQTHIQNSKAAAAQLKTILHNFSSSPKPQLQEIMPLYLVSSTLMDIITTIDKISVSVTQLSQTAAFRNPKATVEPCNDIPETKVSVVIDIHVPPADSK